MARRPTRHETRVAVVGAGIAGLACASALDEAGLSVTVLEGSDGLGGRTATLHVGGRAFDHGAPFIGITFAPFDGRLEALLSTGVVAPWEVPLAGTRGQRQTRLVGVPTMRALALAGRLRVVTGTRVVRLDRAGSGWSVVAESGRALGTFTAVAVAVPAPQAVPLLAPSPDLAARAARAELAPRWVAMLAFRRPLPIDWDPREPDASVPARVVRDSAKPSRGEGERWVVQAESDWTRDRLERDREAAAGELFGLFAAAAGTACDEPTFLSAHLWRYAEAERVLAEPCLWDVEAGLGACGDWCPGGRIPGACGSGIALGRAIVRTLAR